MTPPDAPTIPDLETDVREETDLDRKVDTSDGDHERFAHIVVPASAVTEAYVTGQAGHGPLREALGADPGPEAVPGLPDLQGDPGAGPRPARHG